MPYFRMDVEVLEVVSMAVEVEAANEDEAKARVEAQEWTRVLGTSYQKNPPRRRVFREVTVDDDSVNQIPFLETFVGTMAQYLLLNAGSLGDALAILHWLDAEQTKKSGNLRARSRHSRKK